MSSMKSGETHANNGTALNAILLLLAKAVENSIFAMFLA